MTEDNNPFRPALSKPVDDTVLANDPAADNFLAGNDNLANVSNANMQPMRPTMDSFAEQPIPEMPATGYDPLANGANTDTVQPITDITAPAMPNPAPMVDDAMTAPEPFNLDNMGALDGPMPAGSMDGSMDNSMIDATDPSLSPIGASLAAAADAADQKASGLDTANAKGKKAAKNGQPKQLTISALTIVFCVLFIASTATAIFFFVQKQDSQQQLSDAQAELQELKDKTNSTSNTTNKTTTQFDALQDKIAELTKQNEEKQKVLDENKKSIEDLTKKNGDLTNQLTTAQNKLTSDTQVSKDVNSLITTMCTMPGMEGSAPCVERNGQQQQQQAQQGNQGVGFAPQV